MNTIDYEKDSNLRVAEEYYQHMLQKDFALMESCLHPNVCLIGPLAEVDGRDQVVLAAKNLSQILGDITIRARFASGDQVMLAYDFIFSGPIGELRAAVLMRFEDDLISRIELFFDGRQLEDKKADIFDKS